MRLDSETRSTSGQEGVGEGSRTKSRADASACSCTMDYGKLERRWDLLKARGLEGQEVMEEQQDMNTVIVLANHVPVRTR